MFLSLHELPLALKAVGIVAGVLGAVLFVWLGWHALRRVLDSPRIPLGGATYFILGLLCVGLLAVAAVPLGVGQLLREHALVDGAGTRVAEVRCTPAGAGKVRISFTPTRSPDGAAEQVESAGPDCRLSAELVTLRSLPARLGLGALVRVTNVGEATRPSGLPSWALPGPNSPPPFPMALLVRQARVTSVQAAADAGAIYHLVASPHGVTLERAGG